MRTMQEIKEKQREKTEDLPGYPEYEKEDDIYIKAKHEEDVDPEDINNKKDLVDEIDSFEDDLDIPGSELDDELEEIGNEDEENNYYSLSDNDDLEDLI